MLATSIIQHVQHVNEWGHITAPFSMSYNTTRSLSMNGYHVTAPFSMSSRSHVGYFYNTTRSLHRSACHHVGYFYNTTTVNEMVGTSHVGYFYNTTMGITSLHRSACHHVGYFYNKRSAHIKLLNEWIIGNSFILIFVSEKHFN